MGLHTKAIHAGLDPEKHRGAVSVPIYQSSTFAFPSAEEGAARFAGESEGPIYTRMGNPTVQALEEAVAELENGRGAVATATGMAAVSAVFLAMLKQGDHIVSTAPIYGATRKLIEDRLVRLGVSSTFVPNSTRHGTLIAHTLKAAPTHSDRALSGTNHARSAAHRPR